RVREGRGARTGVSLTLSVEASSGCRAPVTDACESVLSLDITTALRAGGIQVRRTNPHNAASPAQLISVRVCARALLPRAPSLHPTVRCRIAERLQKASRPP